MRRRAVVERIEQEPEPGLCLLLPDAEEIEHLLLDITPMDTNTPAA